jgi:hypothetical protein
VMICPLLSVFVVVGVVIVSVVVKDFLSCERSEEISRNVSF